MTKKEEAKAKIAMLVNKFAIEYKELMHTDYQETEVRVQYLNPFFEALGWDMLSREVKQEDSVRIANKKKKPDYGFYTQKENKDWKRQFFVEAKKPSVNLDADPEPAKQLRRYAWSGKLPVSILTDFEEFIVFDCTKRVLQNDTSKTCRNKYMRYEEYIDNFDYIWDNFSKEAVMNGSLDKYAEALTTEKGHEDVDEAFLNSLNQWREQLAKEIYKQNKDLDESKLAYAMQKIIDRLVFLRIAEDREAEEYQTLLKATEATSIYDELKRIFAIADQKYNTGLFDIEKDPITRNITISNEAIKKIIKNMYYPECPYEFSMIPIEVMGHSYERYLGSEIKFKGRGIAIDTKPEVRKAGGVYYTPQYIVDYIVEQTIGKLLEGKTPEEVANIKVCDPSCGSGSFLIGAYDFLLNWHYDYYKKHQKDGKDKYKYITEKDALSISVKKQILINNIFGVDVDRNAVEITKLSLMIKALEGETSNTINRQLSLLHDKALPTLDDNIKSGNSLFDYDDVSQKLPYNEDEIDELKPFKWERMFKDVFTKCGGFAAVIGNPPYVSAPNQEDNPVLNRQRRILKDAKRYKTLYQKWDLYIPFLELSMQLLNEGGITAMIVPHPLANQMYGQNLRKMMLEENNLIQLVDLKGTKVFADATVDNCIPITMKGKSPKQEVEIKHINEEKEIFHAFTKKYDDLVIDKKKYVWNLENTDIVSNFSKHSDFNVLGDFCYISKGMVINADEKTARGEFKKADLISETKDEIHCREYVESKDMKPYEIKRIRYLEYNTERSPNKLSRPTFRELYNCDKLLFNRLGQMQVYLDNEYHFLHSDTMYSCVLWKSLKGVENRSINNSINNYSHLTRPEMEELSEDMDLHYLLGIMNSKYATVLLNYFRGASLNLYPEHIRNIPIPAITEENKELSDELINHVKKVIEYKKKDLSKELDEERDKILRRLDHSLSKIDSIVYQLYGLSEEEISKIK